MPHKLFLAQYVATLFMTGLIWFVQIVHYPLFANPRQSNSSGFRRYEEDHANRTGWVVFPPMFVELVTALAAVLPRFRPIFFSREAAIASAVLVLVIWASTGLLQVPLHKRLSTNADHATIRRLVLSNWLRTLLWTARAALLTASLLQTH